MTENNDQLLVFNGIDATTGTYSMPPMKASQFAADILGNNNPEAESDGLRSWRDFRKAGNYAIAEGHSPLKLEESGWGVVFPANVDPAVVEALRPLMEWRQQQAAQKKEDYFKVFSGGTGGVRPGSDSKSAWLGRQGAQNFGPVDPDNGVPYYLLLVGSPEQIDYRFQYLLDVQYAVGRICFDTPEDYANYANSVVAAEKQQIRLARRFGFFGTANPDDPATSMSAQQLIQPLADYATACMPEGAQPWDIFTALGDQATKQRLASLLGGPETPALLLTASHGMGFPSGDPLQLRHQGALLCQDWPGPNQWSGPIPDKFYFSADDVASDANLWGTIAFFFACYGAGVPMYDEFARQAFKTQRDLVAPKPFIAQLPQRLLAHPKGGALAAIGHVERAWGYSFAYGNRQSLSAFQSALLRLMKGAPVGYAFEFFNERYAEFSTDLTDAIDTASWSNKPPSNPLDLAVKWTANNDAKNYVVLGDPAVRALVADQPGAQAQRSSITLDSAPPAADKNGAQGTVVVAAAAAVVQAAPANGGAKEATTVTQPANYGLLDNLQQGASTVGASLQQIAQKLSLFLGQAIDAAATLEISTYTSGSMDQVVIQGGKVSGAQLRAVTSIAIDGDTKQVVPLSEDGTVDAGLWAVHMESVRQAQASRAEMLKSAISAISSLASLGGGK